MQKKPFVEKVANIPNLKLLQFVSADHQELIGSSLVMEVLLYFGGLINQNQNIIKVSPDYPAMSRLIHGKSMPPGGYRV